MKGGFAMCNLETLTFEADCLDALSSLYAIRSIDCSIQGQRTCNFCIMKILNALTDDIPDEIRLMLLNNVKEVISAMMSD